MWQIEKLIHSSQFCANGIAYEKQGLAYFCSTQIKFTEINMEHSCKCRHNSKWMNENQGTREKL